MPVASAWTPLRQGQLADLCDRLGAELATGVLTLVDAARASRVFVLRRGAILLPASDSRGLLARRDLDRVCAADRARAHFDDRAVHPPGRARPTLALAVWVSEWRNRTTKKQNLGVEDARRSLGVDGRGGEAELRRAFHRRVRALHPDMHPNISPAERRRLEAELRALSRAYDALRMQR